MQIRREMPDTRFRKVYTFNSARKSMSTIVPLDSGGFRVYTKGASEIIMKKCSFLVGKDGVVEAFNTQMQERLVQGNQKKVLSVRQHGAHLMDYFNQKLHASGILNF